MTHTDTLPQPDNLPEVVTGEELLSIQKLFQLCEQRCLSEQTDVIIYGSVAVNLYFADVQNELPYAFMTNDIDTSKLDPSLVKIFNDLLKQNEEHPHIFQNSDLELWPMHPDWRDSLVDLSNLVQTNLFRLKALHPADLIISKLQRFNPRDEVDCSNLAERYISDHEIMVDRLIEALRYCTITSDLDRLADNLCFIVLAMDEIPSRLTEIVAQLKDPTSHYLT